MFQIFGVGSKNISSQHICFIQQETYVVLISIVYSSMFLLYQWNVVYGNSRILRHICRFSDICIRPCAKRIPVFKARNESFEDELSRRTAPPPKKKKTYPWLSFWWIVWALFVFKYPFTRTCLKICCDVVCVWFYALNWRVFFLQKNICFYAIYHVCFMSFL